jgi:hypothetical protein
MDFEIQNFKPPAPKVSPDSGVSGIPDASHVLPDALVAMGLHESPDDVIPTNFGGTSTGGEGDPNGDTGTSEDEYAILINGTKPVSDSGTVIPASSFIIRVNAGTYEMGGPRVQDGATVTTTLELITGFTGDFPVADGYNLFTVYGKVVFEKDGETGLINGTTDASKIIVEEGNQFSSTVGWSKLDKANPEHVFQIGSVAGSKFKLQRAVFVSQVHSGPYKAGPAANPVWSDFDQTTKTIELGGGGAAKVDKITLTNADEVLLNIDKVDFTVEEGKPIKVSKLVETDSNGVETDKGHVLASQDIDITDKDVEWAKYNGSSTAAGSLEIGGANTSDITDINIEFSTYAGKMTLTNQSQPAASIELNPIQNEGTGSIAILVDGSPVAGIGDSSLDMGPQTVFSSSSGQIIGISGSVLQATSDDGGVLYADASDLPSTATSSEPCKFREVKVCNNGVPATAYILMTQPIND